MVFQSLGALQETQIPCEEWRDVCEACGPLNGEVVGLQDHHARREQGEPHELYRQRAGKQREVTSLKRTLRAEFYTFNR